MKKDDPCLSCKLPECDEKDPSCPKPKNTYGIAQKKYYDKMKTDEAFMEKRRKTVREWQKANR